MFVLSESCVIAVERLQGVTLSYDEVLKACDTRSVWTIDLAVLLANYKQQPLFTTGMRASTCFRLRHLWAMLMVTCLCQWSPE